MSENFVKISHCSFTFCVESGFSGHKFRLPTRGMWETTIFTYYDTTPLLWGLEINYFERKIVVSMVLII